MESGPLWHPRLMAGMTRAALVLLVVAGAACGGGGDDADGRPTPEAGAPATTPEAPEATATPSAARGVRLRKVGDFEAPVYVTAPPGDRARQFVVEQGGRVIVIRDGRKLDAPFLDVSGQVTSGGEQGLLSIAFPTE